MLRSICRDTLYWTCRGIGFSLGITICVGISKVLIYLFLSH